MQGAAHQSKVLKVEKEDKKGKKEGVGIRVDSQANSQTGTDRQTDMSAY